MVNDDSAYLGEWDERIKDNLTHAEISNEEVRRVRICNTKVDSKPSTQLEFCDRQGVEISRLLLPDLKHSI
jgi:hypothetical protein